MTGTDEKSASFEVLLPAGAFSLEALKRAAYALMARADISFEPCGEEVRCILRPLSTSENSGTLERDFRREVLDQDLRISIEDRTEPMRNAVLGLAFSRTGLQE